MRARRNFIKTASVNSGDVPEWIAEVLDGLPPLLTLGELAKTLRVSQRTVRRLIDAGRLFRVRSRETGPSRVLIPRSSLREYLRSLDLR